MASCTQSLPLKKRMPPHEHIFIKSGNKFFKVNFSEIIYIEAMKDYLKIHTADYKLVTHQTMTEMEKILPAKQFIRVHKSFIVAVAHIKSVYGSSIETEKNTIPIGLSYKNSVMNFIAGNKISVIRDFTTCTCYNIYIYKSRPWFDIVLKPVPLLDHLLYSRLWFY